MPTQPSDRARHVRLGIDIAAVAVAIGLLLLLQIAYFQRGVLPGDAIVYLAGGERLNAGHELYALSPGDRIVEVKPPLWTVPLLSPPPIAVLFRPLAALPGDIGAYLWWIAHVSAVLLAIALMARRRPVLVSFAVMALSIPLVYEIGVANLNGFVLLGLVLTWRATARQDERTAGIVTALLATFKLTPAIMGWWLLTGSRWQAVRWAIAAGAIVLAVSIAGAGLGPHLEYLGIIDDAAANGNRPLSLAGMASYIGVPAAIADRLPILALVAGFALIAFLRKRRDLAFIVAVLTLIFGSPTISINWFIYLLACLAPLVWPLDSRTESESGRPTQAAVIA